MNAKTRYNQGEIYLVKFHPSQGKELRKFRPAVVMLDSQVDCFVTISPLTSILKIKHKGLEFIVTPTPTNGLESTSLALCWYLRTVDDVSIQKYLGKLDKPDLAKLKVSLKSLL